MSYKLLVGFIYFSFIFILTSGIAFGVSPQDDMRSCYGDFNKYQHIEILKDNFITNPETQSIYQLCTKGSNVFLIVREKNKLGEFLYNSNEYFGAVYNSEKGKFYLEPKGYKNEPVEQCSILKSSSSSRVNYSCYQNGGRSSVQYSFRVYSKRKPVMSRGCYNPGWSGSLGRRGCLSWQVLYPLD